MLSIRAAREDDFPGWNYLWLQCCEHFGAQGMTDDVIKELWERVHDAAHPMCCWLAVEGDEPIGFAHVILRPHTFSLGIIGYLEDLWVAAPQRRRGVAKAMIGHLENVGRERGWRRLRWETAADNLAARRLYDRVARLSRAVNYSIEIAGTGRAAQRGVGRPHGRQP